MISEDVIRAVADAEFGLQKLLFEKFGSADREFKAYVAKGGKLDAVVKVPFAGDFIREHAKVIAKILSKYEIAVSVSEVWMSESPGVPPALDPARKEGVSILIHTRDRLWMMNCPIGRSPDRLDKGELTSPISAAGRVVSGNLTQRQAQQVSEEIEQLLRGGGGRNWKDQLGFLFMRLRGELFDIAPAVEALYKPDLPADRLATATTLLERMVTVNASPPGADGTTLHAWLLGINVRLFADDEGRWTDPKEVLRTVHSLVASGAQEEGLLVWGDPVGDAVVLRSFVPPSMAHWISGCAGEWTKPLTAGSRFQKTARDWMLAKFLTDIEEHKRFPIARDMLLTLPILAGFVLTAEEGRAFLEGKIPTKLETILSSMKRLLAERIEQINPGVDRCVRFEGVDLFYDALRARERMSIEIDIERAITLAEALATERGEEPGRGALRAVVASARFEKPFPVEQVLTTVWGSKSMLMPLQFQRVPYWNMQDYQTMVVTALQTAGLRQVESLPTMLNAKDRPTDVFGAPMYVDPAGSWFSPMSMTVPAALGVLQTLSLDFLKSEDTDDPVTRSLPLPHMLQRLGLTAMMARRYTPEVYKVVKEALSHVDRSVDDCWDAAGKGHAGLGRMLSTKHAALAVAPATVSLSLQLHWGRAPTVKVRPTLIARIRFVDISSKLKASLVTAPFPFSYVHFGHADPVAQVSFNSGQDEKQFDMTGVFVRQLTHDGGRSLELSFVWQKQGAPMESWISTLLLKIEDGAGQTLEWCIDQALQEAQAPNETREAERAAAEELVKVLFYMGSRDARSIVVTERADAMKDVGKRNAAQQAKVIERARGLYDHILVGPERGMFGDGVDGMSRRQTKVFVRRGHVHGYWTGKGRTVYEAKILDPIVVNRRLLQDGEEPPMPKNYTLH